MDENIQSDILIEGEGLVAAMFSYFLSTKNQDKTINLVLRKTENINSTIYTPGSIFPLFKLPANLMEKVFHRTKEIITDLHSTTAYFEFYQNPYLVLYRDKFSIEQMSEHRDKLTNTKIRHTNLSIEEIESYYPFINTSKEIYLTEIYNSATCSNPYELYTTFLKLAIENDVKVINDNSGISISKNDEIISENALYCAKDYVVTTSTNQCSDSVLKKRKLLKVITPILERFPRVSLYDISTASSMWLEEAGYFHILRSSEINNEKESINRVKKDFGELFSSIDSLEIIDSYHTQVSICDSTNEWITAAASKKMFHVNIPLYFELSAAPSIVKTFSSLLDKKEDIGAGQIPLEKLY